jgi:hypothetical protein
VFDPADAEIDLSPRSGCTWLLIRQASEPRTCIDTFV